MRAKEIIGEQKTVIIHGKPYVVPSLPYAEKFPGNASHNFYHMYRFGIAMAVEPDTLDQHSALGDVGSDMVIVPYSQEEDKIMNRAAKKMNDTGVQVGHPRGKEEVGTYTVSPVAKNSGKKRNASK